MVTLRNHPEMSLRLTGGHAANFINNPPYAVESLEPADFTRFSGRCYNGTTAAGAFSMVLEAATWHLMPTQME